MGRRIARVDGVGIGVAVLTLLGSLVLWDRLPARVAIRFSASGDPNTVVSKAFAIVLLPAVMLATLAVLRVAAH